MKPTDYPELILQYWESMVFMLKIGLLKEKTLAQSDQIEQLNEQLGFRDRLFKNPSTAIFMNSNTVIGDPLPMYLLIPWVVKGKNVISLNEVMQLILELTSIKGWRWSDITLPFSSFILILNNPIQIGELFLKRFFVMREFISGIDRITFYAYPELITFDAMIPRDKWVQYERDQKSGNSVKFEKKADRLLPLLKTCSPFSIRFNLTDKPIPEDDFIFTADTYDPDINNSHDRIEMITKSLMRLLVGLCLYVDKRHLLERKIVKKEKTKIKPFNEKTFLLSGQNIMTPDLDPLFDPYEIRVLKQIKEDTEKKLMHDFTFGKFERGSDGNLIYQPPSLRNN